MPQKIPAVHQTPPPYLAAVHQTPSPTLQQSTRPLPPYLDVHEDRKLDFVEEDFFEEEFARAFVGEDRVRQKQIQVLIAKLVVRRRKSGRIR